MYNVQFPGLGIDLDINPVALSVGNFQIYWYGVIIGVGFMLALIFALRNLRRFGIDQNGFIDCVLVGLICGILGARLYYVAFRWDYYSQNLGELFAIHNGGLAIYGGVIGALAGGCTVARIKKLPIPAILDITMMGFLIGQGLGRWGNFFNQEAFGTETDLPWRMVSENTGGVGVHPCFLYESLWCLIGFVLLYLFSRKFRKYDGQIFLMYLVWYGSERMIVEGLRTDSLYIPFLGLRVSQILAAATVVAGVVLLIVFRKRTYKAVETLSSGAANSSDIDSGEAEAEVSEDKAAEAEASEKNSDGKEAADKSSEKNSDDKKAEDNKGSDTKEASGN